MIVRDMGKELMGCCFWLIWCKREKVIKVCIKVLVMGEWVFILLIDVINLEVWLVCRE